MWFFGFISLHAEKVSRKNEFNPEGVCALYFCVKNGKIDIIMGNFFFQTRLPVSHLKTKLRTVYERRDSLKASA